MDGKARAAEPQAHHAPARSAPQTGRQPQSLADRALTLQQQAGNQAVARLLRPEPTQSVQRFDAGEHKGIGDVASGGQTIYLAPDLPVTYGEVVALAGDLFGDWPSLRRLAKTRGITEGTQGEVWYAVLVKVRGSAEGRSAKEIEAEHMGKRFDAKAKAKVNERYRDLAADNIPHFPNPRKGDSKRSQAEKDAGPGAIGAGATYRQNHAQALLVAAAKGQAREKSLNDALMIEAFGDHFLTDAFSSGHQPTERKDAREYWNAKEPYFWSKFQSWLADQIARRIQGNPRTRPLPSYVGHPTVRDLPIKGVKAQLRDKMGALPAVGFGDLVAGAIHDYFNKHGVQADVGGKRIGLVGDGNLLSDVKIRTDHPEFQIADDRLRHVTDKSKDAFDAAAAAVKAGIAEVHQAYAMGRKGDDPTDVPDKILRAAGGEFAAEQLMPKLAPDSSVADPNQRTIDWELGSWEDVLASPRLVEGLTLSLEKYSKLLDDAISLEGAQKEALDAVLKNRMLGGEAAVSQLIRDVITYIEDRDVLAPGPAMQDIQDLKSGMH